MVKRTGPTNINLRKLVHILRKASRENNVKVWSYIAELLSKPARQRIEVNIGKINKLSNDGDIIIVPGKVLGYGKLEKKIKIAAWKFSKSAIEKIERTGSSVLGIEDILKENPKGSNIKIII